VDNPLDGARLEAIQRLDLFREVVRRIERHIDANQLRQGDRLPSDRDLAATLRVSRPVVRQALKALESLGRVSAQQGSGTFVRDASHSVAVKELTRGLAIDRELLADLLPVRTAVELEVLRSAFERRTPASTAELRRALDERAARLAEGPREASLDLDFEVVLGRVCGNEVLRRLQALVHDVWLQAQIAAGLAPGDRFVLHDEHELIFEAFERGDLEEAVRRFEQHLRWLTPTS
jgi:GntR family transcriptional repressor for pyruvate dehydrogenase complex